MQAPDTLTNGISRLVVAIWAMAHCDVSAGVPEPGLLIFGVVTNASGEISSVSNPFAWRMSNGPTVVTVPATIVVVNGQPFHFARVPFETRSIGPTIIGQTPNTFALTVTPAIYTRSAWLGTNTCSFVNPAQATFTFSKPERGKVERVDLSVSLGPSDPDTDGDGFADWQELLAGTDPHDATSFPRLAVSIHLGPTTGLVIEWASIPGVNYAIASTTNLTTGFQFPPVTVTATTDRTTYHDPGATGPGPFFYRIQATP